MLRTLGWDTFVCNSLHGSFAVCGSSVKQVSHSWHIVLDIDTLYTFLNFITQFISLLNLHLEPELIIVNIDFENVHSVYRSDEIHNRALTSSPLPPPPPPPRSPCCDPLFWMVLLCLLSPVGWGWFHPKKKQHQPQGRRRESTPRGGGRETARNREKDEKRHQSKGEGRKATPPKRRGDTVLRAHRAPHSFHNRARTRVAVLPGIEVTLVGPGRTPTVRQCPYGGRPWVAQALQPHTTRCR